MRDGGGSSSCQGDYLWIKQSLNPVHAVRKKQNETATLRTSDRKPAYNASSMLVAIQTTKLTTVDTNNPRAIIVERMDTLSEFVSPRRGKGKHSRILQLLKASNQVTQDF